MSNYVVYNAIQSDNQVWHRCLGHPNSHVLRVLLKSRSLGNKNSTSSKIDIVDCASCNLVKANRFLFHCIQPTPPNLLNSYILMYGVLHL